MAVATMAGHGKAAEPGTAPVHLVVDGSGSMWERIGSTEKITPAGDTLIQVIP